MHVLEHAGHLRMVRARLVHWLFRRLGKRYYFAIAAAEVSASNIVVVVTTLAIARFFSPTPGEVLTVMAVGAVCTTIAVVLAAMGPCAAYRRFWVWHQDPNPATETTVEVWNSVATSMFRTYRRNSAYVVAFSVLPAVATIGIVFHIGWAGSIATAVACLIPAAYATVISFSAGELLSRPMLEVVARKLPEDFAFDGGGLSVTKRLKIALPVYTMTTGSLAVAVLGNQHGARGLFATTAVVAVVGFFLSTELTVLLGDSIGSPIALIRRQLDGVRGGDYSVRTPVLSSDEFGELAREVNLMAHGLEEREEIRSAFGTYMDKGVVDLILSGEVPPEGIEVTVSILFCDVRGFTSFAEKATAPEVIATLNDMFALIVPIVERNGGHVDKFLGDGLLAVFGTPTPHLDHADRAVAAAVEIVQAVAVGGSGLRVGAGVNTGQVVAGPLGGAGRLNFSVIGDPVNVAARVEAATRVTGDDVLITDSTRSALIHPREFVSRGEFPLKGKAEPLELFGLVAVAQRAEVGA